MTENYSNQALKCKTLSVVVVETNTWRGFIHLFITEVQGILMKFLSRPQGGRNVLQPMGVARFVQATRWSWQLLKQVDSYGTLRCRTSCSLRGFSIQWPVVWQMHARLQYISFLLVGATGTAPELPEMVMNLICISLKFLHTSIVKRSTVKGA